MFLWTIYSTVKQDSASF